MTVDYNDTIAGVATAPGDAGVSVVRISGCDAVSIGRGIFRPKFGSGFEPAKNRHMVYGWVEKDGRTVDEVLLCTMRGPHSFTAEDVVEIHCHGGGLITRTILELAIAGGARLARPGEFTQRAFLNGRIDLTRAEATNDLINAKTPLGLDVVVNQLKGGLYDRISAVKEDVAWVLSLVNAGIDFPEEDVVFANLDQVSEKIQSAAGVLARLIESADTGIMIREGFRIVLAGEPNVGKSSILNGLLEEPRSIVTQIPGTTRDTIEESCSVEGVPISLTDTAGIRDTENPIEKEGIDRTISAMRKADLILWVIDAANPSFDLNIPEEAARPPMLIVLNKMDLIDGEAPQVPTEWGDKDKIAICAQQNEDIVRLRERIFHFISGRTGRIVEDTMLTNLRQKKAAESALESLNRAREAIEGNLGEELVSVDLSATLQSLGDIVGETTPDEMLNRIFSEFCIGK